MTTTEKSESIVEEIRNLFESRGTAWYGGESVSQLDHALQAAMFAEQDGASPELIIAALLHDVGHLLHDLPENVADEGVDDHHEVLGRRWLAQHFPPEVSIPVELHVAAKRYLCATDDDYFDTLSPASQQTLRLQNGVMSPEEVEQFEQRAEYEPAVQLRRWDDRAKIVGMETPDLDHFLSYISKLAGPDA